MDLGDSSNVFGQSSEAIKNFVGLRDCRKSLYPTFRTILPTFRPLLTPIGNIVSPLGE